MHQLSEISPNDTFIIYKKIMSLFDFLKKHANVHDAFFFFNSVYFISSRFYFHTQLSIFPPLLLLTVLTIYLNISLNTFLPFWRRSIWTEIVENNVKILFVLGSKVRSINFLLAMAWLTKNYLNMQVHECTKHWMS